MPADPYTLDADTDIDQEKIDSAIAEQLFDETSDLIYQLVVNNGVASGIVVVDGMEIGFTLVVTDEEDEKDTGTVCFIPYC